MNYGWSKHVHEKQCWKGKKIGKLIFNWTEMKHTMIKLLTLIYLWSTFTD